MIDIYIDADSCPVKEETEKIARRHNFDLYLVSNAWRRPVNDTKIHIIHVGAGLDVADDWIVNHIAKNDIVITSDILLADRCLKKQASAISPFGNLFTEDNIGSMVAGRNLNSYLRETGEVSSHNPAFSKLDRSRFLRGLEEIIQTTKRQSQREYDKEKNRE